MTGQLDRIADTEDRVVKRTEAIIGASVLWNVQEIAVSERTVAWCDDLARLIFDQIEIRKVENLRHDTQRALCNAIVKISYSLIGKCESW